MLDFQENLLSYGPGWQDSTVSVMVYMELDEKAGTDQNLAAAI